MSNTAFSALNLRSVDQISYAIKDIDKTIAAWSSMYGMGPWTFTENGGVDAKGRSWKIRMAFTYIGSMQIELVQCTEGRIIQSRFLDTWGEGLHHVGFYSDDVDAVVPPLVAKGAKLLVHDPGKFAYLDAGGHGGAIFEFMRKG